MGKESGSKVPISLDGPNPYVPGAVAAATAGAAGGADFDRGDMTSVYS